MTDTGPLCVLRASMIDARPPAERWLIRDIWGHAAVGILGGAPKSCKTWLAIDMALSVSSGTPCLGRFDVEKQGPALIYLAEDDLSIVRSRIDCLCLHRELDIRSLELHVIAEPSLRLDLAQDQKRLAAVLEELRPRLLLLDPLIRIHRLDENSATEISGLLSFFRELQRRFDCAVLLVHHASKKQRAQPGQSLRGSSDLHAFGDSNAYLARQNDHLVLTLEHRAAKAPAPLTLKLVSDPGGTSVHLEIRGTEGSSSPPEPTSLADGVIRVLAGSASPVPKNEIRKMLRVNNQRLGAVLEIMQDRGDIERNGNGWRMLSPENRIRSAVALL